MPSTSLISRLLVSTRSASPARSNLLTLPRQPRNTSSSSAPRMTDAPVIYAVDDMTDLTDLYLTLLEATGYRVKTFNDRAGALAALTAERTKPKLLITDYLGLSMSVDQFLHRCLAVHPTLRILMASGFNPTDMRFLQAKPDRFLEKPFAPEDLQREVRAALTA